MSTLLIGSFGVAALGAHSAPAGLAAPIGRSAHASAAVHVAPATYGDLVVTPANSPFIISPASIGSNLYQQGGNITVQTGGTLIVRNITLQFVEFVGSTGDALNRASHLYAFNDQGSVTLDNSTLTTATQVLNAYPKLALNVSAGGQFALEQSTLAFPGWVTVYGSGSLLDVTGSHVEGNSLVANLSENRTVKGDTLYAPSLEVADGAHAFLGGSSWSDTYADNSSQNGWPGMNPVTSNVAQSVDSTSGASFTSWTTWTDSENLTRDLLYPTVSGGWLQLNYSGLSTTTSTGNTFDYGALYPLPNIPFDAADVTVNVSLPATVIAAINAGGIPAFLEATGAFGNAATLALNVGTTGSVNPVNISAVSIHLYTALDYNMTVTGGGSTLTTIDSSLDLNWNMTPGTPVTSGIYPPSPWGSNKLLLTDGAVANLANLTIDVARGGVYWNQSAVIPDATSHANFYRWSAVPIAAASDVPISGAHLAAFYAYATPQLNNATVGTLNNLAGIDPLLASYAEATADSNYGSSNGAGVAMLLLASTQLEQSSLPDGQYLGDYHVAVTLAGGGAGATQWGYASVMAYPGEMTPAGPDMAAQVSFPTYAPSLSVGGLVINVDGNPVPAVTLGQNVTVAATVTNTGTGPVTDFTVTFVYVQKSPLPPVTLAGPENFTALAAGDSQPVQFTWLTNESVVGDFGFFNGTFALVAAWNGGTGPNAGMTTYPFTIPLAPSQIQLTFQSPGQALKVGTAYVVTGTVEFNGSGMTVINLTAVAPNGQTYLIGQLQTEKGPFLIDIAVTSAMPSGTYAINATATYNHRVVSVLEPAAFSIASTASSSTNFLDQTFLGLSVLYWIIIAAAIVAALLVFFFVVRRQARGKLVECGECGQLIPEDATVCPKCGAEFENDLVRCSRCGSTIPASSQVCPECAAQLVGKPEDTARDPERQGYNDFVERFRVESRKELGENYNEGAFWDWWKRQPTYLPFSQWKLQQQQGSRAGMTAPPGNQGRGGGGAVADATAAPGATRRPATAPPGAARTAPPPTARPATPAPAAPAASAATTGPPPGAAGAPPAGGLKPCSNCGKEIPPDYLVCPFCGAVTQ